MPAVCSAYGCTNRSNETTGVSYHKFPLKNEELTKKWVAALRRDKWCPTPASYLCSAHFTETCTYRTNSQRRLLASAVPTEFSFSEHLKKRKFARSLPKRSFPAESHEEVNGESLTKKYAGVDVLLEHSYCLQSPKKLETYCRVTKNIKKQRKKLIIKAQRAQRKEYKFEQVFVEEQTEDADVVYIKSEPSQPEEIIPSTDDILAGDEAWREQNVLHTADDVTLTNAFGMDILEYLRIELLPSCSVQLSRLNVGHEEHSNKGENRLSEPSSANDKSICEDASKRKTGLQPKKTFHCSMCAEKFPCASDLKIHVQTHVRRQFLCYHCGAEFQWESSLKRHQKLHAEQQLVVSANDKTDDTAEGSTLSSDLGGKKYSCRLCKKTFSRRYYMKLHMNNHSGEKPHACKFCSSNFSMKESLRRHMRTHTGDRPYSCALCGAAFTQRAHLVTHVNTHSGAKYTCSVCELVFSQEVYLTRHMRIHTGERPYTCSLCRAKFVNTSSMSRHMRIHTGRKPYSCADCGAKFALKEALKWHVPGCVAKKPNGLAL